MKKIKQAVIFAGGKGTRMAEQTKVIPKPLVDVQGEPIIIHIMRTLAKSGIEEFIILTGYLSSCFTDYFLTKTKNEQNVISFNSHGSNLGLNIRGLENVEVKLVFTGEENGTASRLYQVKDMLDDNFVLTYGDSYSNVNMNEVEKKFLKENSVLTLIGIPYQERFGLAHLDEEGNFKEFKEKSTSKTELVNGGFMCVNKSIFDYYKNVAYPDDFMKHIMSQTELKDNISVYVYNGYWKAVDTERDLININKDFEKGVI